MQANLNTTVLPPEKSNEPDPILSNSVPRENIEYEHQRNLG